MKCSVCEYEISPDKLHMVEDMLQHVMGHLSELAKRATKRYECDKHPNARIWMRGSNEFGWKAYCGTCEQTIGYAETGPLKAIPI